jgi:hypothetical protein
VITHIREGDWEEIREKWCVYHNWNEVMSNFNFSDELKKYYILRFEKTYPEYMKEKSWTKNQ